MEYQLDGKTIAADANGYLVNPDDWSEELAQLIAATEEISLEPKHWDLVNYLRQEYFENQGNQPNTRHILKAMQQVWGEKKLDTKALYDLFPKDPSKQAGKIAGLPESRRKGGY